jgi:hypothetical protein
VDPPLEERAAARELGVAPPARRPLRLERVHVHEQHLAHHTLADQLPQRAGERLVEVVLGHHHAAPDQPGGRAQLVELAAAKRRGLLEHHALAAIEGAQRQLEVARGRRRHEHRVYVGRGQRFLVGPEGPPAELAGEARGALRLAARVRAGHAL